MTRKIGVRLQGRLASVGLGEEDVHTHATFTKYEGKYGHVAAHLIYLVCMQWEMNLNTTGIGMNPDAIQELLNTPGTIERFRKRTIAAMADPKRHKTGELAVETVNISITELARTFIDNAWASVKDEDKDELRKRVVQSLTKTLSSGQMEPRIRETMMFFVVDMVEKELEARTEQIRLKVSAEVEARWTEHVEKLVQTKVDQAIAKIKQEILK